ncbi:hypothetical protein Q0F99_11670 [Rathayibacter oskolensis]|uniref:hypothetical protein n=1 Tax=Rathayibacter oskolensis TaxID=1891671 RepID=UPI00265F61D2|nr:hypothetical protein [Rathayibacter oskolensis]WKK70516.1 hypothetical protein Q0F99_11670 [Rathayibacter oskolensis]
MNQSHDPSSLVSEVLLEAGAAIRVLDARRLWITVPGIVEAEVVLISRSTPPTTAEMRTRSAASTDQRITAYVTPRTSVATRRAALVDPGLALIGTGDRVVILGGRDLSSQSGSGASPRAQRHRPPWGRFALYRALSRTAVGRSQAHLAQECGVSQMAVSKILRADPSLAEKSNRGWVARDPVDVARRFLDEYPGPGGVSQLWYSGKPILEQARAALAAGAKALPSGDVTADHVAPWRRPRFAVLYAESGLPLDSLGFAESDPGEATLRVTVPEDRTIWSTAQAWYPGGESADPILAAWDVLNSGGADAEEAADHLLARELTAWTR